MNLSKEGVLSILGEGATDVVNSLDTEGGGFPDVMYCIPSLFFDDREPKPSDTKVNPKATHQMLKSGTEYVLISYSSEYPSELVEGYDGWDGPFIITVYKLVPCIAGQYEMTPMAEWKTVGYELVL